MNGKRVSRLSQKARRRLFATDAGLYITSYREGRRWVTCLGATVIFGSIGMSSIVATASSATSLQNKFTVAKGTYKVVATWNDHDKYADLAGAVGATKFKGTARLGSTTGAIKFIVTGTYGISKLSLDLLLKSSTTGITFQVSGTIGTMHVTGIAKPGAGTHGVVDTFKGSNGGHKVSIDISSTSFSAHKATGTANVS